MGPCIVIIFYYINPIRHRVNKYLLSMFYVDLEPKENNKEIYNLQYLNKPYQNTIPNIYIYINPNKMPMLQSIFYLTLLYMFRALLSPTFRSTNNCNCSIG